MAKHGVRLLMLLLGVGTALAQETMSGTGTWSGDAVSRAESSYVAPANEAQLPQNWVNTHEGDPIDGVYDETVYLGMSANGCPANGGTCDYVGAAGLQAAMDDWAAESVNKSRHVIVTHGSDFQGSGTLNGQTSGVLLLKSKVVGGAPTNKFIVYESDTPLPADRLACAHGIQDDLPGASDVGFRNNRCDGSCVGGYRSGTGGACVGGTVNSAYNDVAKMWTITATSGIGAAVARGPLNSGFGASHIVLRDMEARHTPGSQAPPASTASAINIDLGTDETSANHLASHLYIDRSYIHEDVPDAGPTASTNSAPNAIKFNCNYCGITNTYIDQVLRPGAEGHIIVVTDSTGPMKIVHNWTEGSSSSLFVGGAAPMIPGTVSVTDLEVRRNRFSYPKSWLGLPGYDAGHGMVRKNGLEIKEGRRILLDGNIIENVDATGGQKGPLLVTTVRSCSGGDCDNYAAEISDLTVTNGIFRHACQGSQGDGRSGVAGSGNSVSEGGQRWKYDNNLWYDIQRTNAGCTGTGMDAGTNIGQKFSSGGSSWTGCTATRQANGLDALVDCGGSPENVLGQQRHNTRAGDVVQITGCTDASFNTGATTEMGVAAIPPTDPLSLRTYYRPPVAPGSASTTGCTFTQYQGWPRDVTVTHTTVVANYNGSQNAYPFASGSQASKPVFMQRFTLKNNIGIGNGWGTSGTGGLEGTATQTTQFDPATLEAHHNLWPTRLMTKYTDYTRRGAAGVSPPSASYFPINNHCTAGPDADCVGMAGNSSVSGFDYNLADWHGYRLCHASDANANCHGLGSAFAGQADDGIDPGFDPAGIDEAQVATKYAGCIGNCGASGPFDDNSSGAYVPVAELYPDLAFGNQVVGTTSSARSVTLENIGGVTLTISSIAIAGTNAADFSKTTNCGTTLAPGEECTISVSFAPSATGLRSASLTVTDDATPAQQSVNLGGTGVSSAPPAVSLTPSSVVFGSQVIGTTSNQRSISLQNTGGSSLTISSIAITGSNANNFAQSNDCGATVAAGASCEIDVAFSPLAPSGSKAASISISDNASGSPHAVSLTGTASTSGGAVTIYPSSTTMPRTAKMPLSCDVAGGGSCSYSVVSGAGSVSGGVYTAPAANTTAVVRATNGSNSADATIVVSGTIPAASALAGGSCAPGGYSLRERDTMNICTATMPDGLTRKWGIVIPDNYRAGTSGLILSFGNGGHGLGDATSSGACAPPGSEVGGWGRYVHTVPAPAPVLVCLEGPLRTDAGSGTLEYWDEWARVVNATYAATPDDAGDARLVIFKTISDLNLDSHAVMQTSDWNPYGMSPAAAQSAAMNADIIAVLGTYNDGFFHNLNANRVVNYGPHAGTQVPNPKGPISVIALPGFKGKSGVAALMGMCGNNTAASTPTNHVLTHDDIVNYWEAAAGIPNSSADTNQAHHAYGPATPDKVFCDGTYANGIGNPTGLEYKRGFGGRIGTEVSSYRLVGQNQGTPFCSFDWNGNDTLGCNMNGATIALDLRNSACNWQTPCNHYVNATTGYDIKGLMYKFFLNHYKP